MACSNLQERLQLYHEAVELHKRGLGSRKISKLLGVPRPTVLTWFRGAKPGNIGYRFTSQDNPMYSSEIKAYISEILTGRHRSDETKSKMSQAAKARIQNPDYINPSTRQEVRVKLSEMKKRNWEQTDSPYRKPEYIKKLSQFASTRLADRNPNWRGGRSMEPYPWDFQKARLAAHQRDKKCVICGESRMSKLQVHHKDANKQNNSLDNLITLCRHCHNIVEPRFILVRR